ncbi:MAG TPA: DinB family protein [Herpetosiphonaceae bacterium]
MSKLTHEQVLTLLAAAPPRIDALTAGLAPEQLRAGQEDGGWSINEVLAHLRSCADVWGNCIEVIIAQDKPTIRAINPTTWINGTNYREQEFQTSLQAFTTQRTDLLAVLEALDRAGWLRTATITGAGKPLVRSVHAYAQWLAAHERSHLKQIERIVKALR